MSNELQGVRVAFVVANEGIEEIELLRPWRAVVDAGGTARARRSRGRDGRDHAPPRPRRPLPGRPGHRRADAADYDAVVLPGGVANPDHLRTDAAAVDFLMAMFEAGKPVAAICHGPWTLIEGDLVAGRTLTSWPSLQTDLRNAGAYWVDRDVVVCRLGINTLVTSRGPEDLDVFCRELTAAFAPAGVLVSDPVLDRRPEHRDERVTIRPLRTRRTWLTCGGRRLTAPRERRRQP